VVELLGQAVPVSALVVAVDPGKVSNRVWLTSGERGLIGEPVSLPVREGVDTLGGLIGASGVAGPPVIGVEATGGLHRAWVAELERRFPGSVRLVAPSETKAARVQLGSRRFKTDDRDCAALVWLLRQGAGRPVAQDTVDALLGAVRHRRGLVADRKVLQQRLHDQLQALCPGLSAPAEGGRALHLDDPAGQAVLACAAAFAGRAPTVRSLVARAPVGSSAPPPGSGSIAGDGCCHHPQKRSCAPSAWAVTWPATSACRPTSPRSMASSAGCWPPPAARSLSPCPGGGRAGG
jgi:Transposase